MTIDGLLDGMDRYNEAIVAFAASQGIPVVTDREGVPADDEHYVDWAHMTDRGNASMAERFRRFFVEQGLITRAIAARQSASSDRTVVR